MQNTLKKLALLWVFSMNIAWAGSMGGSGGGQGQTVQFDLSSRRLIIPGPTGSHLEIVPQGSDRVSTRTTYAVDAETFARILNALGDSDFVTVEGDSARNSSYRILPSDDDGLELQDRRAAIRYGISK